jgi:hypothetical protein
VGEIYESEAGLARFAGIVGLRGFRAEVGETWLGDVGFAREKRDT